MKEFLKNHPKLKNPYFWLGLIGIIFASAGIDANTLTSWYAVGVAIIGILQNPVAIVAVITAFLGVYNDNGTKGLDGIKKALPVVEKEVEHQESDAEKAEKVAGICWSKTNSKWKAYIKIDGKQKHLGYFANLDDAIQARKEAEEVLLTENNK